MNRIQSLFLMAVSAGALLLPVTGKGTNFYWIATATPADWSDGANWTNDVTPGPGAPGASPDDNTRFYASYTGTVNVTDNTEIINMSFETGSIDLTLNITSGKTLAAGRLGGQSLAVYGPDNITVTNGTLDLLHKVYLQAYADNYGLTIKNNGIVRCTNDVYLGGYNQRQWIVIQEGGQLLMTNTSIAAILYVGGDRGSGGGRNSMLVNGSGSRCSVRALNIGQQNTGANNNSVTVTNGGELRVTEANLNIGFDNTSAPTNAHGNTLTVTGSGSTAIQLSGYTYVGYQGSTNRMTVENSAYAQAAYLRVGNPSYAIISNTLAVKSGASLRSINNISVYSNSVFEIDSGSVTATYINVEYSAQLKGYGSIEGNVTNSGTLTVGNANGTGTLAIAQGDLTFQANASANFTFTSAGFETGTFGVVQGTTAGKTATFDGTLNLTFNHCRDRQTVKIFDFPLYAGSFDAVNVSGVAPNTRVTFNAADGTVTIVPSGTVIMIR